MGKADCRVMYGGQAKETKTKMKADGDPDSRNGGGSGGDGDPDSRIIIPGFNTNNATIRFNLNIAADCMARKIDFGPFAPIGLSDKDKFNALFESVNPQISDLTFSNLFMWRNMINFRVAWLDGFACILAVPRLYPPYIYAPVGDVAGNPGGFARACECAREFFETNGWKLRFRCVPADIAPLIARMFDDCECEEDRDFFDYLYLAEDLIWLRGKRFDGKRNHINKFRKLYDFGYERLTKAHIDDCRRIMYDRCVDNDCDCLRGMEHACDRKPSAELLDNLEWLDCKGAIIRVGDRYEAFTVGEALNRETAVIYIEKANAAIAGLYAYVNQQFCERDWSGMTYINREEDEGVPGLRKAKLSYHPIKLIEKYTIICK